MSLCLLRWAYKRGYKDGAADEREFGRQIDEIMHISRAALPPLPIPPPSRDVSL
ncbi:hypothetical protein [Hymenobacter terricola]|uniref:hypothetical protein n=1 Tax=Hymenobacter terricola TaxID=2819236 RepID=UPI001B313695|nr:hypothetical protein [Hymenobacter terricola]